MNVVICQNSLRQADPLSRGVLPSVCVCVSLSVMRCNNNSLLLQRLVRRGQTKKERKKERKVLNNQQ